MHVKKLEITNFRGIRQMELELHPRMNVFIGINGAGKSSVLDALGYLLSPFVQVASGQYNANNENTFPDFEIHNDEAESLLNLVIVGRNYENLCCSMRSVRVTQNFQKISSLHLSSPDWQHYISDHVESNSGIVVYYRVRREVDEVPITAWTNRNFRMQDAFIDALAPKVDFKEFFEWFRNREDLENEERAESKGISDQMLKSVRKVIGTFCGALKNVRVRRRDPLRMVVTKNNQELRIEQLSDGEKCLLAMVGDLARRLAIANPSLEKPLEGEGVVLIDEVDLHLHPQWQRMILPRLMETFPNCQFIVTTHSPQILGELKREEGKIIPLKDGDNGIKIPEGDFNVFGQTSDVILVDVMETSKRNSETSVMLDEIFKAIDANNLDEARALRKKLEETADGIPEFAKIELLLHRKEKLGK